MTNWTAILHIHIHGTDYACIYFTYLYELYSNNSTRSDLKEITLYQKSE